MAPLRVLVIDDERNIRTTLVVCLESLGCVPKEAASADAALEALRLGAFDLALLDLRLGAESGLELLPRLLAERPGLDVVVITAYATFDTAVEAAEGGTLFLDEIGEISPGLQAKLLRFLQEKRFERVGETRTRIADVRIVAATNKDLDAQVKAGQFREDLLYRLDVVAVTVPPLRDRPEDILPLARRFLAFFGRTRATTRELSPGAERALLAYAWPGNVRELRNALERAVILSPGHVLEPETLPERIAAHAGGAPILGGDHTVEDVEREHILRVLARVPTAEEAARILGIDASTLWRKRKKLDG